MQPWMLPRARLGPVKTCLVATSALLCVLLFVGSANAATSSPTMTVSPTAAAVGSKITVSGLGFPPSTSVALRWGSVNASWQVQAVPTPQVTGIKSTITQVNLGTAQTDASGAFSVQVVVPADYGGQHVIQAFNGTSTVGFTPKAIFTLEPSFHISPTSGPDGTPINVKATGLSYGSYSTSYHLSYDNDYVGYMTALDSSGSTNFTFYASGTPGLHYIDIYQGYPGPGYLNPQQGPPTSETQSWFPPDIPFYANFTVTPEQFVSQTSTTAPAALRTGGPAGLGALAVAGAALSGGALFVSRMEPERRRAVSKVLVGVVIIALVAVAGVGLFMATGTAQQAAATATAASTSMTTSASATVSPASVPTATFTPVATVFRPHINVITNPPGTGPSITVTPDTAIVGEMVTVSGQGFVPNAQLPLVWTTRVGSNLLGYQLVNKPIRNVTAGADGSFSFSMKVPPDLGGYHYIAAGNLTRNSNGTLFIQRSAVLSTTQGPQGTQIQVIMHGVGWDFNTNIVAVDYDNSYIGYACGFNSGGNVTVTIVATGAPGIHTIDVYPSEWWGPSDFANQQVVEYRYPLLTPQDHPELMPSFHFTFLMTPGPAV